MATTDFVMPKLGLTMTEGTVARWDVAPGGRFKSGDIIVVVETDKIAYDVEAPASGILQEVLVAAGNVAPVGAPIGRWDIGDSKAPPLGAGDLDAPVQPAASEPGITKDSPRPKAAPETAAQGEGARILATPFARRLARQGGIALRDITGSGPRGRIKAADVERALAHSRAAEAQPPVAAARAALYSAGVEIDVSALLALNAEVNRDLPDLRADLIHYVVLATAKASKASDVFPEPPAIGLAAGNEGEVGAVTVFTAADCRSLRGVVARIANPAASVAARGVLWIERARDGISFLSAEPPSGWQASLGIGSVRDAFRPDADGRPVRAALVDIVLTASAADFDARSVQRLLLRIRDLLQSPLLVLAS